MNVDTIALGRAVRQARHPRLPGEKHGRRGIVRRGLLAADALGLVGAFVVAAWLWGPGTGGGNRLALALEYGLFILTLPGWIFVA